MHILCTICSDLVNQAENIFVTKCGHIFHHNCLSQWIPRSKSCPQCRNKVTEKCMFRIYPTISNENTGEDITTLQSRLDDTQLQLRQLKTKCNEKENKIKNITAELKKNEELLKEYEKKLVTQESAVAALKEQLKYVQIQNRETQRLKEENEVLNKNLQTLNGLQKVLNATSEEVEQMLEGYTDVRTVATFATALKRALCDSECKKNESRDRLQAMKQQLAAEKRVVTDLQAKILQSEETLVNIRRKYFKELKQKRNRTPEDQNKLVVFSKPEEIKMKMEVTLNDTPTVFSNSDTSFNSLVNRIENADSPYLNLKQSSLALTALQRHPSHPLPDKNLKPSEFAILNSAKNAVTRKPDNTFKSSIFHKKGSAKMDLQTNDANLSDFNISYDGLGGHSKLDIFPVPSTRPPFKSCVPKLSAKHKLKRPNPPSHDLEKFFKKKKDSAS